jgi:hypothetical protein
MVDNMMDTSENVNSDALTRPFSIVHLNDHIRLDCDTKDQFQKKDLVTLIQLTRAYILDSGKNKLLVMASSEWNIDIATWSILTKLKFGNMPFKIAVVAMGMHQHLLLSKLAQLNPNVKSFSSKKKALEWLRT